MAQLHQAQLRDGRWVRLRELTSDQQAQAYEAASERSPSGALLPNPNPVRLDTEAFKLALVAVSVKKPLWKTDKEGKPVPRLDGKGKPVKSVAGKPLYERTDPADFDESDWKPLTYGQLETEFDKLFDARDRAVISKLYATAHNPPPEDADFFESIQSVSVTD